MPYVVDGNNLIGQSREQNLKDPHARVRLIRELAEFCRQRNTSLTVVFDGDYDPMMPGRDVRLGHLRVLFSGRGREADALILGILAASEDPAGVTVVTSDRSLAGKVRHARGRTLRSHQFRQVLRSLRIAPAGSDDIRLTDAEVADWLDYFSKGDGPPEGVSE